MGWQRKRAPWFALMQGFHARPRFAELNELEILWWVLAVDYAATHQTDGAVPERAARRLLEFDAYTVDGQQLSWAVAREHLLRSGLVEQRDSVLILHDYLDHNPPRAHAQQLHEERAQAGKKGAERRWKHAEDGNGYGNGYGKPDGKPIAEQEQEQEVRSSNSRGSQAAPPEADRKPDSRGTRLPADWQPSPELIARARDAVPSVDLRLETDQFRDWALSASGAVSVKRDWDAAWRTWMRRRHAENLERGWKPAGGAPAQLSDQRAKQQAAIRRAKQESFLRARGVSVAEWEKHERAGDEAWLERVRAMAPMEGLEGL